jgi:choloylglycine hydrolase
MRTKSLWGWGLLRSLALGLALAAVVLPLDPAHSCTTFCFEDGRTLVFGKNYDWNVGDGLVVVNRSGVEKTALVEDGPATWTSAYASVTFNQYGREFPSGGINARGLVVELMWLDETEYPPADRRGAIPTLQWIQYQLDTAERVGDVIASDRVVRITNGGSARIHFLVADATGEVATIEFLAGKMIVHRGKELPYPVLSNDTYEESAAYARAVGRRQGCSSASSLDRFARAAGHELRAGDAAGAVRNAFALLDDVAQGDYTQWSIVYDLRERRAYFKTRLSPEVRWIDVDAVAAACVSPTRVIDVHAPLSGDVAAHLATYRYEVNRRLVDAAFDKTPFLRTVPPDARERHARFPESTVCADAGSGPPHRSHPRGSEK